MSPATAAAVAVKTRPEISVYWKPGCSSCLKTKEYVEELGLDFESVNVLEDEAGFQEVLNSGLRSIPAVRLRDRYVYSQNLDDVAKLLGVDRLHTPLSQKELFDRWDAILTAVPRILEKFSDADLAVDVIPNRKRSVKDLFVHIGQLAHAFVEHQENGLIDIKPVHAYVDSSIVTKADVQTHLAARHAEWKAWRRRGEDKIPEKLETYYGLQPSIQVVERGTWHTTQHARQLDLIAAGRLGAEFEIAPALYAGLPLPKRLWA
jgi:glutaredoxin